MDPSTQQLGVFTPLGYEVTLGIAACMLFIGFLLCYLGRKYVKFSLFVFGFIFVVVSGRAVGDVVVVEIWFCRRITIWIR